MKYLSNYIKNLLAKGRYFFSKQDVLRELGLNENQLRFQAYRLSKKRVLKRIRHDFFMIITSEYFAMGSLPPQWIVDAYMKHVDQEYYIGLLSAASFYGATEQQPMTFQVITTKATKPIQIERGSIEFHVFKECMAASKTTIKTPVGYAQISTREQTIVDLVRFYEIAGHLSNVASVIKILSEEIDITTMTHVIEHEKTKSVLQRLGYLFEILSLPKMAKIIEKEVAKRKAGYILLRPDLGYKSGVKNSRWKIIINNEVELP